MDINNHKDSISLNLIVLGNGSVGKTSLIKTYISNTKEFNDKYKETLGINKKE